MPEPTARCPACRTEVPGAARFCGSCGADLVVQPAPGASKRTMLGMVVPAGLARPLAGAPGPSPSAPAAPPEPPRPGPTAAAAPGADKRTMLGMAVAPEVQQAIAAARAGAPAASSATAAPVGAPVARGPQRTMLGVTRPPGLEATPAGWAQHEAPTPVVAPPAAGQTAPPARSHQTILGTPMKVPTGETPVARPVAAPPSNAWEASAASSAWASAAAPARSGDGTPRSFTPASPQVGREAPPAAGDEATDPDAAAGLPRSRRSALVLVLAAGMLVTLGAAAALLWWWLGARGSEVLAHVEYTADGPRLVLEVAEAPTGLKVRFGGVEAQTAAGRASFPLARDALKLGDNELRLELVAPSGEVEPHELAFSQTFRLELDPVALEADEPGYDVVVEALPGTSVALDGETLPLDPRGRGSRHVTIAEPPGGAIYERTFRYLVRRGEGPGLEGDFPVRLPYVTLHLDRPGSAVITDRDAIEVAGAVPEEARVTVDQGRVSVAAGRFVHRLPLPQVGAFSPRVVARQAGHAPTVRTLSVRRVADLAVEAARFEPNTSLRYARIQQNPTIYRGQRVAFEGRVYNVPVESGQSVLQMLVTDCPPRERCPLWVSYPAATEATVGSWVRVLGTLGGEQQFRSRSSGEVVTVPRVEAVFVLPLDGRAGRAGAR